MRSSLFLMLFAASAVTASAQITFGLKAGLNLNDISYKGLPAGYVDGKSANVGYHAGVFSQVKISKAFSVLPELQFIQRGAHNTIYETSRDRINLNYLELPILFGYSPVTRIQLELGPSFSALLSAKSFREGDRTTISGFGQHFETGVTTGIRLKLTDKLSLIGRYYHALTYTDKVSYYRIKNQAIIPDDYRGYNYNIQFSLAYKLFSL